MATLRGGSRERLHLDRCLRFIARGSADTDHRRHRIEQPPATGGGDGIDAAFDHPRDDRRIAISHHPPRPIREHRTESPQQERRRDPRGTPYRRVATGKRQALEMRNPAEAAVVRYHRLSAPYRPVRTVARAVERDSDSRTA